MAVLSKIVARWRKTRADVLEHDQHQAALAAIAKRHRMALDEFATLQALPSPLEEFLALLNGNELMRRHTRAAPIPGTSQLVIHRPDHSVDIYPPNTQFSRDTGGTVLVYLNDSTVIYRFGEWNEIYYS